MTALRTIALLITLSSAYACAAGGVKRPGTGAVLCRAELDRAVLPAGQVQTAVLKITLDAPAPPPDTQRPPVNLAVVLDRSGSMSGIKLERAKQAAIAALRRLDARDRFSLITYYDTVDTVVPAQSADHHESIEPLIHAIEAGGNSALFGGVSQAAAEIRRALSDHYVHRIVLLSDGRANRGPQTAADLGRLGAALFKDAISVSTIGVGDDYNEDLMTQLALNSDGNTYFVQESEALPEIFAAELGNVLSIVATRVRLSIECADGVRPVRLIGRDGRIHANRAEVGLNHLYGRQQKYALLEVELPASVAGLTLSVATARVSYQNALRSEAESVSTQVVAMFADMKALPNESFYNGDVQSAYLLNSAAVEVRNAVDLADEGKTQAAVETIRQQAVQLRSANIQLNDSQLSNRAQQMEQQVIQFNNDGWNPRLRKQVVTDNAVVELQQQLDNPPDMESVGVETNVESNVEAEVEADVE